MRVLITTSSMDVLGGASLYVRELALELAGRGHEPAVYSPQVGAMAAPLSDAGIPVVQSVAALDRYEPDVIHGQHHLEALTALLRFPNAPAVYVSHGAQPSQEYPPAFPRVLRYLAVSQTARERAAAALGASADDIELSPNWVDLKRFAARAALPSAPRRALMLGNHFSNENGLRVLREACREWGVELDARGSGVGDPAPKPEEILPDYDLVFGLGKAALEAAAVGCGVILCHPEGVGPMLTRENLERVRRFNLGLPAVEEPLTTEAVGRHIGRFDAAEAALVSQRVRETASVESAVDRLVTLYEEVVAEFASRERPCPAEELRAVGAYLEGPGVELLTHRDVAVHESNRAGAFASRAAELARRIEEIEGSLTWRTGRLLARLPLLRSTARDRTS